MSDVTKNPRWLPFIGVVDFDDEVIAECGLDHAWRWRGLVVEWFGCGCVLAGWPTTKRYHVP